MFEKAKAASDSSIVVDRKNHYCIIGAGPAGLSIARVLKRNGIPYEQFERHMDVGGLWDITNPASVMYESAHMISSRRATQFSDFPMPDDAGDYPHNSVVAQYFRDFASSFGLYDSITFGKSVKRVERAGKYWDVTLVDETRRYRGVIIANGHQSEPKHPKFKGTFAGEILHSAEYKSGKTFDSKRVLVVGAGNSGCDIVLDAVRRAKKAFLSMRRGYYIVPKYALFGIPMGDLGRAKPMPLGLDRRLAKLLLKLVVGDPQRFGIPQPDHEIFERHSIVNSQLLYYLGHGAITVKPNVKELCGDRVVFEDDSEEIIDVIVSATGYHLSFPFIDKAHLNWRGAAPDLHLNVFHPLYDNLFVVGLVESVDGGNWRLFECQAEAVAAFIKAQDERPERAERFRKAKAQPLSNTSGCALPYHVRNYIYRRKLRQSLMTLTP